METLAVSSEVLVQLEDLALKHNLTVDKVVENLLEYYSKMQQVAVDIPEAERFALIEADSDLEEFSPEDIRKMLRDMTDEQLAKQSRRSA